jgi:hypothetical protein
MRACELCGVEFEPSKPSQRFCTSACRKRAHRQREREASAVVLVELPRTEELLELSVARAAASQWRISIFELSRIMGTSVKQIDKTYGHLARDSEDTIRARLNARIARVGVELASESEAE